MTGLPIASSAATNTHTPAATSASASGRPTVATKRATGAVASADGTTRHIPAAVAAARTDSAG